MRSDENLLFISVLLVTYNEEKYIERALGSLLSQDYPSENYEIIIIDGGSTDATLPIAKKTIEGRIKIGDSLPEVRFLNNPKKILAAGWNIGIQNARADYVIRIDAHAAVLPDFLRRNVETMMSVDAICVGGRLITHADDNRGEVIRDVLSSPFGVGNSSFRMSNRAGYADTVVYGLYKKEIFERVGYFDEKLVRNQDIEMHSRIKRLGEEFYFNPEIVSVYYSRSTVKKMLQQAYGNGLWNLIILRRNHAQLSLRHLVPLIFVCFVILSGVLGFFYSVIWTIESIVLLIYLIFAFVASIQKSRKLRRVLIMPALFFAFHICYGVGSLIGLFKKT